MEVAEAFRDAMVAVSLVVKVDRAVERLSIVGCGLLVMIGGDLMVEDLVGERWGLNADSSSPILVISVCRLVSALPIAFCSLLSRSRSYDDSVHMHCVIEKGAVP